MSAFSLWSSLTLIHLFEASFTWWDKLGAFLGLEVGVTMGHHSLEAEVEESVKVAEGTKIHWVAKN